MIANAKAVAHGIRAMLYVSGESRNKKHPEKITRICDNFMPQGMDATGIWTEMKFATMNHPNIKNNVIRMEISPAMEHTENFTIDDWRRLWYDFAAAFDEQEIRDKDGKVVSPRTNVSGSKSSVWLHEESKSGIPHLHAVVCPTRCLTSSMTSSTTKNLPTGRICRTWRWPILHCSLLLTGRFQVAVEAARSPT